GNLRNVTPVDFQPGGEGAAPELSNSSQLELPKGPVLSLRFAPASKSTGGAHGLGGQQPPGAAPVRLACQTPEGSRAGLIPLLHPLPRPLRRSRQRSGPHPRWRRPPAGQPEGGMRPVPQEEVLGRGQRGTGTEARPPQTPEAVGQAPRRSGQTVTAYARCEASETQEVVPWPHGARLVREKTRRSGATSPTFPR